MDCVNAGRALWFPARSRAELRAEPLSAPRPGQSLVRALYSAISPGTEQLVFGGRVPAAIHDAMRVPYMGGAFEEICRDHARRHSQERLPAPAQEIGQIWGADHDIDVAGKLLDGSVLYGECKWWRGEVGESVLDTLIERAERTAYGRGNDRRQFVLYARTGYKAGVRERAAADGRIVLHTPETMLSA